MTKWRANPWAMLITLSLGYFMTMLDLTIVNVAIPSMVTDLHASLDDIGWVINAYVLVLAVLLITAGRLGDMLGSRNLFVVGVAVFVLASAGAGLARAPGELIAARAVQGVGAALLLPQTMAIIIGIFPAQKRGAALGIWGAVAGLATVAGPTVGGLLVSAFDWRWVFFLNLPIGVVVIALAIALIPDGRSGRRASLDVVGVLLSSAGLVLLSYGLLEGQRYGWGSIHGWLTIPLVLGVGALLSALFVLDQARKQARWPLIPFSLFADRNYTLMNLTNMMVSISMVSTFLPLSIYLQSVLGFSALKTGLVEAPLAVVSMLVAPFAGRLVDRIGGKFILLAGLLLFGAGIGYIALVAGPHSAWPTFLPGLVVGGLGLGCTFGPMQVIATYSVPPQLAGAASGVLNSLRQFGSVIGSVLVVLVLQARAGSGAAGLVDGHGAGPATADQVHALVAALVPTVVVMVVGAALTLGVRRTELRTDGPPGSDLGPGAGSNGFRAGSGTSPRPERDKIRN